MKDKILGFLLSSIALTTTVLLVILWVDGAYEAKYGVCLIEEIIRGF